MQNIDDLPFIEITIDPLGNPNMGQIANWVKANNFVNEGYSADVFCVPWVVGDDEQQQKQTILISDKVLSEISRITGITDDSSKELANIVNSMIIEPVCSAVIGDKHHIVVIAQYIL